MNQRRLLYFVLVWQFFLEQMESAARIAELNSVVKDVVTSVDSGNCCCSITRIWSLHLEKALEDGKWLEDVSILAWELSRVA